MNEGRIIQVMGPVVDVRFPEGETLPRIGDALKTDVPGRRDVMEVMQHTGAGVVRTVMLTASEGLARGMRVIATGGPISVQVGEKTLGRLLNVTGDPVDGGEELTDCEH